jgi:hypothetical protein
VCVGGGGNAGLRTAERVASSAAVQLQAGSIFSLTINILYKDTLYKDTLYKDTLYKDTNFRQLMVPIF